jgi:alkanesulfonate monooxygenase SsuD/methylene tetrahydromethanopterin reductase-like flavin-dependent oxidoreductase (luciferase family)
VRSRPGRIGFRISAVGTDGIDWGRLSSTWALAGELGAFDAGWMSDHLVDVTRERGGTAFEAFTTLAVMSSRVPGMWLGTVVASNTFRHPAMVAKAAVILDNATGGRFILGLGAGWHEGEHEQFGIPLLPIRERFDRYESAVRVLASLFSDEARRLPGVTLDDPFYPLKGAMMDPVPMRPEGPALWLGGQRRRGIDLAARFAEGWPMPGNRPGDVGYFAEKRGEILRALDAAGRDPAGFVFAAQMVVGGSAERLTETELADARRVALDFVRAGADHVIMGLPGRLAPDGLIPLAREVADPVRDTTGG